MRQKTVATRLTVTAQVTILRGYDGWLCTIRIGHHDLRGLGNTPSGALAEALAVGEAQGLDPDIAPADLRALFAAWEGAP